jgi:hypothetical protein
MAQATAGFVGHMPQGSLLLCGVEAFAVAMSTRTGMSPAGRVHGTSLGESQPPPGCLSYDAELGIPALQEPKTETQKD